MMGFRERYQTAEALQALRQAQERSNEWGLGFFMAAVDVSTAYDAVPWNMEHLELKSYPRHK
eukprot:12911823-Prorocentrum_lima.AAC.1